MEKKFYHNFDGDKIKINWNKKPITMQKFLSFLIVETTRTNDRLGSGNGWTLLENKDIKLKIALASNDANVLLCVCKIFNNYLCDGN